MHPSGQSLGNPGAEEVLELKSAGDTLVRSEIHFHLLTEQLRTSEGLTEDLVAVHSEVCEGPEVAEFLRD